MILTGGAVVSKSEVFETKAPRLIPRNSSECMDQWTLVKGRGVKVNKQGKNRHGTQAIG
jgi:hypothetical protein